MDYHKSVEQIIRLLESHDCWFESFEHEPVVTCKEAVKTRPGYTLEQGVKALIIRAKIPHIGKKFVMIVFPAHQKFDTKKVNRVLNTKDIRFATVDEVLQLTDGVQPGGIPPFGNIFSLEIIADKTLFEQEKIVFNAGDRRFSLAIKSEDYLKTAKPRIENII
ncbi:MAG TPA: YbaK/EbsC family protein [Patescibacteria group bacterium]|nr:YbaK/EbsC family protein [Patescibacteria group bacterium]